MLSRGACNKPWGKNRKVDPDGESLKIQGEPICSCFLIRWPAS